ncbi:MAG: hypothetical protein QOE70_3913 [Chthoniobacter sp.]|nr:hypothetical protein [Chthoniobacter sp.]
MFTTAKKNPVDSPHIRMPVRALDGTQQPPLLRWHFGVWLVDRRATEIALKGFGLVESAVGIVDAGVARTGELIATSRTEVRQASETIAAVGARAEANSPVLSTGTACGGPLPARSHEPCQRRYL